jgi:hypothetical protein
MTSKKTGWRNDYHARTSFFEIIGKDVKYYVKDLRKRLRNGGHLPVIVTYPDFPSKRTTIFKIADALNFRLTNKLIKNADLIIYFQDITHGDPGVLHSIKDKKVLNIGCTDISKNKVDEVHLQVFGYNTFIDPTKHQGAAVRKSDINALHDGEIIQCPIAQADSGSVYQVLLDNVYDENYVVDYRVPVIGHQIPLVYKKFKEHRVRFTNEVHHATMHNTEDVFSADEQALILRFAQAMNVEFCEFDILRHADGRLFIIDVNKTPYGPPAGLPATKEAVSLLTQAFQSAFLK